MGRSKETFGKKEKEKKRRKKKQDKLERRQQRKLEKAENGPKSFEDMIFYMDEDGNPTSTPPDPKKRKKVKLEDIVIGVPSKEEEEEDPIRTGRVKFFNHDKGYGFIIDSANQANIFVHANNTLEAIQENDRVTFEIEESPKGPGAVNVKLL